MLELSVILHFIVQSFEHSMSNSRIYREAHFKDGHILRTGQYSKSLDFRTERASKSGVPVHWPTKISQTSSISIFLNCAAGEIFLNIPCMWLYFYCWGGGGWALKVYLQGRLMPVSMEATLVLLLVVLTLMKYRPVEHAASSRACLGSHRGETTYWRATGCRAMGMWYRTSTIK